MRAVTKPHLRFCIKMQIHFAIKLDFEKLNFNTIFIRSEFLLQCLNCKMVEPTGWKKFGLTKNGKVKESGGAKFDNYHDNGNWILYISWAYIYEDTDVTTSHVKI